MRDLYEVFNDFNMEEEKDLEVMNDLEKQKWKKKLRKEIKKPMKTGRKVAVSAGCLGIAAGLFFTMSDSEVMAKARKAVEETYRSIAVWVGGDRKSTRLNSSHVSISYAVFCLKK